jgi:hypothetical protein
MQACRHAGIKAALIDPAALSQPRASIPQPLAQTPQTPQPLPHTTPAPRPLPCPPGKEFMVHSGFLNAYDSVKVKVLTLVDQLTARATKERPWKVFVTGHSLGGALATLCAYELAGRT